VNGARLGLVALLALAGCSAGTVGVDDVVTELSAAPSTLVADGKAESTVKVCSVASGQKAGLKAKLTVSGATWSSTDQPSLDVELDRGDGCGEAVLVAPQALGPVHVWADVEGYEKRLDAIALTPAPVTDLLLSSSGAVDPSMVSMVQVTARALGKNNGAITLGTRIAFSLAATPTGSAYLTTNGVVVSSAAMPDATTTVVAGHGVQSLTVTVDAFPPGATTSSKTVPLTIDVLP
jgi:hypothetical protein